MNKIIYSCKHMQNYSHRVERFQRLKLNLRDDILKQYETKQRTESAGEIIDGAAKSETIRN